MSAAENIVPPPPYVIPVDVKVYDLHSPFSNATREQAQSSVPVYTNSPCIQKFVSFETVLGRSPGMTTCTSCQQQVMTNIFYKIGGFAWLMCFVFILCGLVVGCCLIPFFVKHFKDVYHCCPRCNQVLHIEKRSCC